MTPDCDRSDPDERIAFGFHNLSRNYDALGHCVTFWGYDNVVKEITNIGVGPRGGRKMRLIEADERQVPPRVCIPQLAATDWYPNWLPSQCGTEGFPLVGRRRCNSNYRPSISTRHLLMPAAITIQWCVEIAA